MTRTISLLGAAAAATALTFGGPAAATAGTAVPARPTCQYAPQPELPGFICIGWNQTHDQCQDEGQWDDAHGNAHGYYCREDTAPNEEGWWLYER